MTRMKSALKNSGSRFVYEIVGIVCSFILPRLILTSYGSDVNGLVLSITRFLSISTFIDAAVGGVCRAALYEPLARGDNTLISRIYVSATGFYRKIGAIFGGYTLLIACLLPVINSEGFGFWEIFFLTAAISVSMLVQFLLGATNTTLIYADQKVYLTTNINTITLILNTIATFVMIKLGGSIQIVKLTTSLVFTIRPIFAYFYCKKHYRIDRKATYDVDPIKNKWSGFSHQIAETVRTNVDVWSLTALSVYANVSIYSVYVLITDGLTKLIECIRSGMGPSFGNMLATEPRETVRRKFGYFDWVTNVTSCILFSCAGVLILPFVLRYTAGVTDADYAQPVFALFLIISTLLHNMKHPYLMIIFAAGHYKETRLSAYIEMIINLVLSVVLVQLWGLTGVGIGATAAMIFRLIYCSVYLSRHILMYPVRNLITKLLLNGGIFTAVYFLFTPIRQAVYHSYMDWVIWAIPVAAATTLITLVAYSVCYRAEAKAIWGYIRRIIKRK